MAHLRPRGHSAQRVHTCKTLGVPTLGVPPFPESRPGPPGRVNLQQLGHPSMDLTDLWVPITSSTLCDQVIFVDHASDVSPSSDAVQVEVDRLG
jgi:hypothetical protein